MKKVLLFLLLFTSITLTGCSLIPNKINEGQRLVCSQKVKIVDVEMIADFSGNMLNYLGFKYETDLSNSTDKQIEALKKQDMCDTVKKTMSNYTEAFTNCKQGIENKKLIITADFDLDKIKDDNLKKAAKIEDVKASLEKQNYECVIYKLTK